MASPVFLYLSDDPQAYLLFLKDYIRPSTDVCYNCKVRCLDNLIKTASAPDLAWNCLSPDERPRPAHTLLDAQLADLGINSSNNYGLDLSEEEIDKVFQPAVHRLTLDINWYALVDAFAAMTCSRAMGGPDPAHYQFDQYKLGKKILWMACPRFTAQELVRPRPTADIMSNWLWNLAQLLSDGADVCLASPSLPDMGDEHLPPSSSCPSSSSSSPEPMLADPAPCTCPIFSVLNGKHPDTYNGYEWINLILLTAQQRIEPALLEAWSKPLNEEELLSSSAPYRPFCPGYNRQTDRNWQEDQYHKGNNVVDTERYSNGWFEISVNLVRLLGAGNEDADALDSFQPGFLLPTGTPFHSASIAPQFKEEYLQPYHAHLPPSRFAHSLRQRLLKTFLARTFRLNPRYDTGNNEIPDLFVRAIFASFNTSSSSHPYTRSQGQGQGQHPLPLPPMKSIFDHTARSVHHHRSEIMQIPLGQNQDPRIKPFRMPRCQREEEGGSEPNGFTPRPSSTAQGWPMSARASHGTVTADRDDRCLFWGCLHMMRLMFDWEGGVLGWELESQEAQEGGA
ncbi:hypothetical protein N0V85_009388 [Neurospora sp. IMI 360204]|nr:hypothetical protein N0V85_009388 [Neurospora sp. IMI 360204]